MVRDPDVGVISVSYSQMYSRTVPVAPARPATRRFGDHIAIDVVDVVRDAAGDTRLSRIAICSLASHNTSPG